MWDEVIVQHSIEILAALVQTVLLALLSIAFAKWRSVTKSTEIKNAIDLLQTAVNDTVGELNTLWVDEWKKAQNGKLTKAQIEKLKKDSIKKVKENMTQPALKILDSYYTNIDDLIESKVQAQIDRLKKSGTSKAPT